MHGVGPTVAFTAGVRITLKFWILALGAAALVAARATHRLTNRPSHSSRLPHDQVSNDWPSTARIREDEG